MIYVTSDLHGWPLKDFRRLLQRAGFSKKDFLFVLGDVIDRGPEGAELLRWLAVQPNIQLILGNHEAMMLACSFLFTGERGEKLDDLSDDDVMMLYNWMANGGRTTLEGFVKLIRENPQEAAGILEYLREAPLYEQLEVGGRKFVLVHGGLDNFSPEKDLSEYTLDELVWARPSLDTRYYSDATVIIGHTPTIFFGEEYRGRPVYTDTWVCIDIGAAGGIPPMMLRLDDMKEFY